MLSNLFLGNKSKKKKVAPSALVVIFDLQIKIPPTATSVHAEYTQNGIVRSSKLSV